MHEKCTMKLYKLIIMKLKMASKAKMKQRSERSKSFRKKGFGLGE